jgi:hypothetical protein
MVWAIENKLDFSSVLSDRTQVNYLCNKIIKKTFLYEQGLQF